MQEMAHLSPGPAKKARPSVKRKQLTQAESNMAAVMKGEVSINRVEMVLQECGSGRMGRKGGLQCLGEDQEGGRWVQGERVVILSLSRLGRLCFSIRWLGLLGSPCEPGEPGIGCPLRQELGTD